MGGNASKDRGPQGILRTFSGSLDPGDHPCPGARVVRVAGLDTPPLGWVSSVLLLTAAGR